MKKTWSIIATTALLVSLGLSATGCNKDASEYLPSYEATRTTSFTQELFKGDYAQKRYSFGEYDDLGNVVVNERKYNEDDSEWVDNYKILNLKTGVVSSFSSKNVINVIDGGFFYSVKTEDADGDPLDKDEYTLYTADAKLNETAMFGYVKDGVFYEENGNRWYVDHKGAVATESNPFKPLVQDLGTLVGDYYVDEVSDDVYYVYEKDGSLKETINAINVLDLSENDEIYATWAADGKCFVQVVTTLPEDTKKYDFAADWDDEVPGVEKYDVATYSYNLKKGKVKEVKGFDYLVEDAGGRPDETALLWVQDIKDQTIGANVYLQCFDAKGKVAFDVQKLVPGAVDYDVQGDFMIFVDNSEFVHIYKGEDCVLSVPSESFEVTFLGDTNYVYYGGDNSFTIYDLASSSVVKTVSNCEDWGKTANNSIWYSVENSDDEIEYYIYNVSTGTETKKTFGENETFLGSFSSSYYTVSVYDEDEGKTTYSLFVPNATDSEWTSITGLNSVSTSGHFHSYEKTDSSYTYTDYIIISTIKVNDDGDRIYTYHLLTSTETYQY